MLDLSETIAGQYCARLLSDFGARVYLLEPPGGSVIRKRGPFSPAPDASSLLFFHLNTGKHSVAFDGGQTRLSELAASVDIAIVGNSADAAIITQANPSTIVAVVTDFGTDGPSSDWAGGEMLFQAMSGMMVNNGAEGLPPLYGCGHRASYAAGVAAYCGVLAAVHERSRSGLGQVVDIAIAEIAAAMTTSATAYNYSGISTAGRGRGDGQVQCRGEWVTLWIYPNQWNDFCVALEVPHLLEDPRFSGIETRQPTGPN